MAKTSAKPVQSPRDLIRSWDAFDRLFEEAFAPQNASTPPLDDQYGDEGMSSAEEEYQRLQNEARRVKRSTTTTRRRTFQKGTMPLAPDTPYQGGSMMMSPPPAVTATKKAGDLHRTKSRFHFHHSKNSNMVTAVFELPDVKREDVHVAYQRDRLTITYHSVVITESKENGQTIRERKERKYARTLPLPPGTQFDTVKATLEDGRLTVSYPKSIPDPPPVRITSVY